MSVERKIQNAKLSASILMAFRVVEGNILPYFGDLPIKINEATVIASAPDSKRDYEVRFVVKAKIIKDTCWGGIIRPRRSLGVKVSFMMSRLRYDWRLPHLPEFIVDIPEAGLDPLRLTFSADGRVVLASKDDRTLAVALQGFILNSLGPW